MCLWEAICRYAQHNLGIISPQVTNDTRLLHLRRYRDWQGFRSRDGLHHEGIWRLELHDIVHIREVLLVRRFIDGIGVRQQQSD